MHKKHLSYVSPKEWLVEESRWDEAGQNSAEARFTLGNGYLGSRGILEENPRGCWPGTYLAGVYDSKGAHTPEIVNCPNPVDFRIRVGGEKLDVSTMEHKKHRFVLDMRNALLYRGTRYINVAGRKFEYSSVRFFSMKNKHAYAMQVSLTPVDEDIDIFVEHQVNLDTFNKGILTEGTKRHIKIMEFSKEMSGNARYFRTETYEYGISICYASLVEIVLGKKKIKNPHRTFSVRVKKGKTVTFTKYFSIYTSRDKDAGKISSRMKIFDIFGKKLEKIPAPAAVDKFQNTFTLKNPANIKRVTIKNLENMVKDGFEKLFKEHTSEMARIWEKSDLKIYGNGKDRKAVRFNIYHLIITGNEKDEDVSIPAKTLSGEGYSGHIFWDTEIFILPFFIYTRPKIAGNILMYRYNRLVEAGKLAKKRGFKGAMFPWESEAMGKEATPTWFKDVVGNVIKIYTAERENHIVSDIAYAVCHYYNASGDTEFMVNYGMEILVDTAKFWISRIKKKKGKYVINNVIGPDELHENVNNSVYTNYCAAWNIKEALKFYGIFKEKYGKQMDSVLKNTGVRKTTLKRWEKIAEKIKLPSLKGKVIEQFDGYFEKKFVPLRKFNEHGLPLIPSYLDDTEKIAQTQLIKQSDIIMMMVLFSTEFDTNTMKKNFRYYLKRNTHKSSLSPSMEGIMAAETGHLDLFYKYFKAAAFMDLYDVNRNAADGVHGASLGGVWQMIFVGLLGFRITEGVVSVRPRLIREWKGYCVKVKVKENELEFAVKRKGCSVKLLAQKGDGTVEIIVYGQKATLNAGKIRKFPLKKQKEGK